MLPEAELAYAKAVDLAIGMEAAEKNTQQLKSSDLPIQRMLQQPHCKLHIDSLRSLGTGLPENVEPDTEQEVALQPRESTEDLASAVSLPGSYRPWVPCWLRSFKNPESQLARWLEQLQEYDCHVIHRAGHQQSNGDVLSRTPGRQGGQETCTTESEEYTPVTAVVNAVDQANLITGLPCQDPYPLVQGLRL